MSFPRLILPVLPESASPHEAVRQMTARSVSASVVKVGGEHYLLDFATAIAQPGERRSVGTLVVPKGALTHMSEEHLEAWFGEPSTFEPAEGGGSARDYALLNLTGVTAEVAMRDALLGAASAPPVMYECTKNPDHGPYTAVQVGTPPLCPSPTHAPPKPKAVQI
jgi:hypothetical protein